MTAALLTRRPLVVAPRMPAQPRERHGSSPFDEEGDIVVECETCIQNGGRVWNAMGPRRLVGQAVAEHNRMFHSQEVGVVLLNQPRQ